MKAATWILKHCFFVFFAGRINQLVEIFVCLGRFIRNIVGLFEAKFAGIALKNE